VKPFSLRPFARSPKLLLFGVAIVAGAVASASVPIASADDISGLASLLGTSVHGFVAPRDIRWEPSGGVVADYTVGRRVLFLASETVNAPRDVYRASVRLSPEGHVLGMFPPKNLTATPLGDDHALVADEEHAAFATFVYGQEQTVTWLDLAGEHAEAPLPDEGVLDRVTAWFSRLEETGSGEGIHRVELSLVPPARAVGLEIPRGKAELRVDLIDGDGKRPW
jgi:hypothetical protein